MYEPLSNRRPVGRSEFPHKENNSSVHPETSSLRGRKVSQHPGYSKRDVKETKKISDHLQPKEETLSKNSAKRKMPPIETSYAEDRNLLSLDKRKKPNTQQSIPPFQALILQTKPMNTKPLFWGAPASSEEENRQTQELLTQLEQHTKAPEYKKDALNKLKGLKLKTKNDIDSRLTDPNSGSFHNVYFQGNRAYRFIKPELDREKPGEYPLQEGNQRIKVPYSKLVLYTSYISYNIVKDEIENNQIKGVRVVKVYNDPLIDGFWEAERLYDEVNLKNPKQKQALIDCFHLMWKEARVIIRDFRPVNVKADKDNNLVIIDFCEDPTIQHYQIPTLKLLADYINDWADGNASLANELMQQITANLEDENSEGEDF